MGGSGLRRFIYISCFLALPPLPDGSGTATIDDKGPAFVFVEWKYGITSGSREKVTEVCSGPLGRWSKSGTCQQCNYTFLFKLMIF